MPTAGRDNPRGRAGRWLLQAVREFAAVPLSVIAGFIILAALSIFTDESHLAVLVGLRHAFQHIVGAQAATSTLQTIASGLVTVTSITFSVLLLAVQQTAASLSPVVFDQFVRRRTNQMFLGFFLGLTLYAYVVLTAVQDQTPPVLGAGVATLLTIIALAFLLVLIYTTIDQMRPANVLRQIHDRTLRARSEEAQLIRRTRRDERSHHPVSATYLADTMGYVIRIDVDKIAHAVRRLPGAEVRLHVPLGHPLAYGDRVATVRDDDEADAQWLADEVRAAVLIGPQPDLDRDASTGIDEIGNIAWTSASTAKHNPEIAHRALHALRDILARWLDESNPAPDPADDEQVLPIVYPDEDLDRALDTLYSILVAAHESQQHMTADRVLATYEELLPKATGRVADHLREDLTLARRLLDEIPTSRRLERRRGTRSNPGSSANSPGASNHTPDGRRQASDQPTHR